MIIGPRAVDCTVVLIRDPCIWPIVRLISCAWLISTVSLPRRVRDMDLWGMYLEDGGHCGCPMPLAYVVMEVGYIGWYCHS